MRDNISKTYRLPQKKLKPTRIHEYNLYKICAIKENEYSDKILDLITLSLVATICNVYEETKLVVR